MFKVIEFINESRYFGDGIENRNVDYIDVSSKYNFVDNLKDLKVKLFNDYIDVEYVKNWFGNGKDEINIDIEDVFNFKRDVGVMSVNEEMSLYIFKVEDVCDIIERVVYDLEIS